jgi:hypothetical protein
MSLSGQSLHYDRQPITSGLPRTSGILSVRAHVSKVPAAEERNDLSGNLLTKDISEANGLDQEQIHGGNVRSVVSQKGPPSLTSQRDNGKQWPLIRS